MRWRPNDFALPLAVFAASCGGGPSGGETEASFPETPYATVISEQQKLVVEVRTSPGQPPARGNAVVQLRVLDAQGAPLDGIDVKSTPWMPAMGHGASVEPTVSADGDGKYILRNVGMFMAGRWELHTTFSGPVTDRVVPVFDVP